LQGGTHGLARAGQAEQGRIRAATIGRFAATAEEFDAYCIEVGVREFGSDTTATIYR